MNGSEGPRSRKRGATFSVVFIVPDIPVDVHVISTILTDMYVGDSAFKQLTLLGRVPTRPGGKLCGN